MGSEEKKPEGPPKPRVVQLKDLGPQLPLGIMDTAKTYHKELAARVWKLGTERELGDLRDKNRDANFAQYVSMILGTMCTKLGPHAFDGKALADKQVLVSQMFMCDVLYAYIWLRVESLGPNLNVEVKCPSCNGSFPFAADLNTLEVTCADTLEAALWDYALKHPIKIRGRDAKALRLGPTRWNAMESTNASQFNTGQMKADIVRYSIHEVSHDGEKFEPMPVSEHELDELSKLDFETLAHLVDKNAIGPDMSINDKCRLCSRPFTTSIDWGYESFFAISSP